MHLVVFPFLIFTALSVPVLLLWPRRGLSFRNLSIAVGGGMAGLAIGFACTLALHQWIGPGTLLYFMFVVLPSLTAFAAVMGFGNEGFCISKKGSALHRSTSAVLRSVGVAVAAGLVVAGGTAAALGGADSSLWSLGVALPLSIFAAAAVSGFIERSSLSLAFSLAASVVVGALLLLLLSPYVLFFLPAVLYAVVSSFVFPYALHVYQAT